MDDIDRRSTPGDHGELGLKALEIELAHDALMTLFHEEPPRAGLELLLNELELALGEAKACAVVLAVRVRVRKEDLGRGLLDDRATDGAL